jgi:hypothetical protein
LAVHLGFFRPGGEEYALAERYLRLGHHHQRPRHRYQGELVSEYLAKGPSSMSRSWQGSRLIEEEMRRGGHRTLRGRPVCHVHWRGGGRPLLLVAARRRAVGWDSGCPSRASG